MSDETPGSTATGLKKWLLDQTRLRPSFLVIGAMRCGTTSLYRYLCEHPLIVSAVRKEVHFFDHQYQEGMDWYSRQFPSRFDDTGKTGNRFKLITGEASPSYLLHPLAPQRAATILPQAKLIAILRDPVARAFSHYQHGLRRNYETLPFNEAIEREPGRVIPAREKIIAGEVNRSSPFWEHSYCTRGCYMDQLDEWLKHFPRENLLVLISEEFYENPSSSIQLVTDFLKIPGMETRSPDEFKKYNHNRYEGMDTATRDKLVEYFKPHNERLAKFLGRDLPWGVG